jgi:acetolactate synthase I/II/III large subunit
MEEALEILGDRLDDLPRTYRGQFGLRQRIQPCVQTTGAEAFARVLADLGVRRAFGIFGGGIALFCSAMRDVGIEIIPTRHESGAAFMACEAHFVTDEPVVLFTTTGPGATNAITGMVSAAWDGAKLIVVTGGTNASQRGRAAFQETGPDSLDISGWLTSTSNYLRSSIDHGSEIASLGERLAAGLASPSGFLANVTFPLEVQAAQTQAPTDHYEPPHALPRLGASAVERVYRRLRGGNFVIWLGFGARKASAAILELAERTGAPVMTSARAKGVFPESHPQCLGVTGMFGGDPEVQSYFHSHQPDYVLVLGSRLGQNTSCFDSSLAPARAFIHVDIDPEVFGLAYPDVETLGVTAEISELVEALVELWPPTSAATVRPIRRATRPPLRVEVDADRIGLVHPRSLMASVQRVVVDRTAAIVMADAGNSFAWANAELRFEKPGRYRTTSAFASMTTASSGIVGAALASSAPAVAIVGDGAMLMGNEVSTAVGLGVCAKWIVLNDACYGMIRHGMIAVGMESMQTAIPTTDFALMATALGAVGIRVERASELDAALELMMATPGPVIVDVAIDPDQAPPFGRRNAALAKGWED